MILSFFPQMRSCSWTAVPCVLLTSPRTLRGSLPSSQVTPHPFCLSFLFGCTGICVSARCPPLIYFFYLCLFAVSQFSSKDNEVKCSLLTLSHVNLYRTALPSMVIMWSNLTQNNRANKVELRRKVNIRTVHYCYFDLPVFVLNIVDVGHSLYIIFWLGWSLDTPLCHYWMPPDYWTLVLWFRKIIFKTRIFCVLNFKGFFFFFL